MRIEIGPKDIENGECVMVRRDTRKKLSVAIEDAADEAKKLLDAIQSDMFARAAEFLEAHTYEAADYETFKKTVEEKPGFIKAFWCEDEACEDKIKEDTKATSRCIPFAGGEDIPDEAVCVCCGRKAKKMVYWGRAY